MKLDEHQLDTAMDERQLAEIKARLEERPPISALAPGKADKSPVAAYLNRLRNDQIALVREIERLRALLKSETGDIESERDVDSTAWNTFFEI